MLKYLFLFTITPVQSFVEQARKTQDLYAGSFLLSHLCRTAGNKIHSDYGGNIIFPDLKNQSIPNRFIAIIDRQEAELKSIGENLQQATEDEFKKIANTVINNLKLTKPKGFDEQVENYFAINWIFLPYNEADYKQCYSDIESLMGAIKTVRAFKQFPDSERGRKCSICGERNVKFYRMTKGEKDENTLKKRKFFSNDVYIIPYQSYNQVSLRHLQSGEGLCALCFTKRCFDKVNIPNYEGSFSSTAKIALFEAFRQLKERRSDLIGILDSDKYEPQGIFILKNNKSLDEIVEESQIKDNTQTLYSALKDFKIGYSPYYAVMLFDGDSMGEWLTGDRVKNGSLLDFHKALTERLGFFANHVRTSINEPKGVTVYAGGEDFLGFFNLAYLLAEMKTLRENYDEIVNKPLKVFFKDEKDNMTFSAGIVIAHIKTPLSEILNWARKMEKEAKEIDNNKDAFAIAVLKHSGEIEKTVFKWRFESNYITDIISLIASEINADSLSNTFIKKLNQEMLRLMDKDGNFTEDWIIKTEIKRIVSRSCMRKDDESKEAFEERKKNIHDRLKLSRLLIHSKSVANFIALLNISDFMARQIKGESVL